MSALVEKNERTPSVSLYELTKADLELQRKLTELDLDGDVALDTLEGERGALEAKMQSYIRVAANFTAMAKAIEARIPGMRARADALQRRAERMEQAVHDSMVALGIKSISCPDFDLAIHKLTDMLDIFDVDQIPAEFMRVPEPDPPAPQPNKRAIMEAINAGIDVPGAKLKTNRTKLKVK